MDDQRRRAHWELTTILSLFVGYAGYYVCRSVLSVATPLIIDSESGAGIGKEQIGKIVSTGIFVYSIGKLFGGVLSDYVGGRRIFLLGMIGSVACTMGFGLGSGLAAFTVAWSLNRLVQSMGWSALVKISSNWFSFERYGRAMGWLCLSYLVGDWLARNYFSILMEVFDFGWRELFLAAAGMLGAISLVSVFTLKAGPRDVGLPEPRVNPRNLFGDEGAHARPASLIELLGPFARSGSFWLVCVMSVGLTIIRETLNFWLPTYLIEVGGVSAAKAANYSSYFPLVGGLSVLLSGYITDHVFGGRRGFYMAASLAFLLGALVAMTLIPAGSGLQWSLVLVNLVAFLLMAPYAFLTGAISLDLGGKKASASAAGFIDSAGYFASSLFSGYATGVAAAKWGWHVVFGGMAAMAGMTAGAAALYWILQERGRGRASAMASEALSPAS